VFFKGAHQSLLAIATNAILHMHSVVTLNHMACFSRSVALMIIGVR